jgi:DNA primase
MISEKTIREMKDSILVSDVVGRYVTLKKKGREFIGLSPFTSEKTPSFSVNDEKGFYHCFSSGKHGDSISFLMEVEGYDFNESIEVLSEMSGIKVEYKNKAHAPTVDYKKIREAILFAENLYKEKLMSRGSFEAREYLRKRDFSKKDILDFNLGFSPNQFEFLTKHKRYLKEFLDCGLVVKGDNGNYWDRFRNRIMFPIKDSVGRTIGFGGRDMSGKDAKYLNSSDGPTFNKSNILYNLDKARKSFFSENQHMDGLIVVEGYTDVMSLSKHGIGHSVSPMGTALTIEQMNLLWKVGCCPVICLDGDKAGVKAAYRSVNTAIKHISSEKTLKFCILPNGQDPDDFIRKNGKNEFLNFLHNATPFHEFIWEMTLNNWSPLDTPEKKSGFKSDIINLVNMIDNKYVREDYKSYIFKMIRSMDKVSSDKSLLPLLGPSPWDSKIKKQVS